MKWKMIAGIDINELVLLKFTEAESQSQLRWEHSMEFEYKGQMYDIVKKEIKGDISYYWCWLDHEETKLNRQLDSLVAQVLWNNPQRQEKQNKLIEFFKKLYSESNTKLFASSVGSEVIYFCCNKDSTSVYLTTPVPPPRKG